MKATALKEMILESREAQLRYLPQSVQLEEAASPCLIRATMLTVGLAVLAFVFWAALADIKEVARAPGEIVPQGFTQLVQHLDGGMVAEILTEEGASVKKGDVLLRLNDGGAREDLAQARIKAQALEMQAERLRAFNEGRDPDFSRFADEEGVARQKRVFVAMIAAREQERKVIEDQIAQKRDQVVAIEKNVVITEELLKMREDHDKNGSVSRSDLLESRKEANSLRGELAMARGAIKEFESRLSSLASGRHDEALRELEKIENDLAQTKENETKLENRVGRLDIRAPEDGVVKGLKVNTIGEVVQAGATLMEIIPVSRRLVVEARVSPRDIGYIKPGAQVRIKVSSFDFSRYGAVEGNVDFITATTFMDERGQPYYRARIVLSQDYVGGAAGVNALMPGMTVEADIVTGEKSVLSYLLKPLHRALSSAMTER